MPRLGMTGLLVLAALAQGGLTVWDARLLELKKEEPGWLARAIDYVGEAPMPQAQEAWRHASGLVDRMSESIERVKEAGLNETGLRNELNRLRAQVDELKTNEILFLRPNGNAGHPISIIRTLKQADYRGRVTELLRVGCALSPFSTLPDDVVTGTGGFCGMYHAGDGPASYRWFLRSYPSECMAVLKTPRAGGRHWIIRALPQSEITGVDEGSKGLALTRPNPAVQQLLIGLARDESWEVRAAAMAAIAKVPGFEAGDAIRRNLWHRSADTRAAALSAIETRGDLTARKRVIAMLDDPVEDVQREAVTVLIQVTGYDGVSVLRARKAAGKPFPDFMEEAIGE